MGGEGLKASARNLAERERGLRRISASVGPTGPSVRSVKPSERRARNARFAARSSPEW